MSETNEFGKGLLLGFAAAWGLIGVILYFFASLSDEVAELLSPFYLGVESGT